MKVPPSTISWHSRSYSAFEPSHQTTCSGLHSPAISSTQASSFWLLVGVPMVFGVLLMGFLFSLMMVQVAA